MTKQVASPMRLLILGGTAFVGRHLTAEALRRGHEVTLFNRGTRPCPFVDVELISGDRRFNLDRLAGRSWDAALDTSGYVPGQVRASSALLSPRIGHYTFVSTLSVYADAHVAEFDESAPIATIEPAEVPGLESLDVTGPIPAATYGESYGPLKALCEVAATQAMFGRALVVRPGLIVGPHDYTDRFTYWPERIAEGGDVLAPGSSERRLQMIDVRDLAEWILDMIEREQTGTFNVTGPPTPMGEILRQCQAAADTSSHLVWIPDDVLLAAGAVPWVDIPLWIPASMDPGAPMRANTAAAVKGGLRCRTPRDTISATLAWNRTRRPDTPRIAGLPREWERNILESWRSSAGTGHATDR